MNTLKSFLRQLDYSLLGAVGALSLLSLLMIYSTTHGNTALVGTRPWYFVLRQAVWFLVGAGGLLLSAILDYKQVLTARRIIYLLVLGSLIFVLVFAHQVRETTRWIALGPLRFLPSEFAKIGLIITLGGMLNKQGKELRRFPQLLWSLVHVGVPALLIFKQPALGSALTVMVVWAVMVFASGARLGQLAVVGATMAGGAVAGWFAGIIKPYQKSRLLVFLNPHADPLGAGYHLRQSKIAIGAGGLLGAGLFKGSQTQLHFIPDQHTDFIFTTVGEELGFVGAVLVLALFAIVVYRAVKIALEARDRAGLVMAAGVAGLICFHVAVNVGMTIGLAPPTGVALPFFSYGGSQVIAMMLAVGILESIYVRRNPLRFSR